MKILSEYSPLFTQLQRIAHPEAAFILMTTIVILNLAKKINFGNYEPFPRELHAYGDRHDGNSYHKFADNIKNYFAQNDAISEQALATQMREILQGGMVEDENLAFLPCLTAVWFISESARNPMTTLTSLILLDLLESGQQLLTNGKNWYTWEHILIHPEKVNGVKKITTPMGNKVNIDDFGGCHPMAHSGSFTQTQSQVKAGEELNVARQKEAHLLIHWLQIRCAMLSEEVKQKNNIKEIRAITYADDKKTTLSTSKDVQADINRLIDKIAKEKKTIEIKQKKDVNADISSQNKEITKLESKLQALQQQKDQEIRKTQIKKQVILPLLRLRLSSLDNYILPSKNKIKAQNNINYVPGNFPMLAINEEEMEKVFTSINNTIEIDLSADLDTNMNKIWNKLFAATLEHGGISGLVLNSSYPGEFIYTEESLAEAEEQAIIGPRAITNWQLQDVEDEGNCFYDTIIAQMQLINHPFLATVPEGTLARDSLRLRVQGREFTDRQWADDAIIETLLQKFPEIVLAVVDTRRPERGFVLRYLDGGESITSTEIDVRVEQLLADPSRRILRIAATGNHFLSVRAHPLLSEGALLAAFNNPNVQPNNSSSILSAYNAIKSKAVDAAKDVDLTELNRVIIKKFMQYINAKPKLG